MKALWSFPWLLVSMVDTRVSQADREEMTEQYDQKGSCYLPGGFARKLKVRGKTGKDLCHVQVPNPWGGFVFHQSISEFDKSLPARGGMHACCMHADPQDIRDEFGIGSMLLWFSRLLRMQICDVELRNHRNREGTDRHGKSRWAYFVTLFTNREAKGSQVARLKARETMRADAKRSAQPLPAAAAPAAAAPAAAAACSRNGQ